MPRNPSTGVYSKPAGTTPSVGQVIDPVPWNALTTDLGNEITNSLPRDGSAPMVAPDKQAFVRPGNRRPMETRRTLSQICLLAKRGQKSPAIPSSILPAGLTF
ncbi:hypothetical protein E0H33_30245 [Rhizobium leguminosarum bv. viciae]|nr:hypothetical protein [Rhizobium leguminosarum bv. viciae]TBZ07559.1 hypothetical protein E0H33_30245 [Rhizobium leguminosarum bv. viciae]